MPNVYKNVHVTALDLHAEKAIKAVKTAAEGGKIFSVQFVKKDGSIRDMNCRLGVEKHLKGGTKTLTDNYICVFDMQSGGYRSVNPQTLTKVNGKTIS